MVIVLYEKDEFIFNIYRCFFVSEWGGPPYDGGVHCTRVFDILHLLARFCVGVVQDTAL